MIRKAPDVSGAFYCELRCGGYCCFADGARFLGEGLDAVGADAHALAIELCPLEIGALAGLSGWIVVTAQKDTASDHARTFMTLWAFDGHSFVGEVKYGLDIVSEN